jgi:hypothetical protein
MSNANLQVEVTLQNHHGSEPSGSEPGNHLLPLEADLLMEETWQTWFQTWLETLRPTLSRASAMS